MKKTILFLMFIIICSPIVLAQEEVKNTLSPDSPVWMWHVFDRLPERARLALTFNPSKKAELRLQYIRERNEEMALMLELNKPDSFEKARQAQEKDRLRIQEEIQQMTEEQASIINQGLERSRTRLYELQELLPESLNGALSKAIKAHEETIARTLALMRKVETGRTVTVE